MQAMILIYMNRGVKLLLLYSSSISYSLDKGCDLWWEKRKRRKKKRREQPVLGIKSLVERCCPETIMQTAAPGADGRSTDPGFLRPGSSQCLSNQILRPLQSWPGPFLSCVTSEGHSLSEPLVLSIRWGREHWSPSQDGCGHWMKRRNTLKTLQNPLTAPSGPHILWFRFCRFPVYVARCENTPFWDFLGIQWLRLCFHSKGHRFGN